MSERTGQYDKRNFLLNLAEGTLWIAGSSLIASQTVLPALILHLGGGNVTIGALNVIVWVGLFSPQLFAARITQTIEWKKPWAIRFGAMHRCVIFLIGVLILVLGNSHPMPTLVSFFFLFATNQVFMGISTPGWFDMYAKMTPLELRGRLTGIRNALAGAGSFACGFLLTWLLAAFEFPLNYGFAFLIASVLQFSSLGTQFGLVEEIPSKVMPRVPLPEYYLQLRRIFSSNAEFRKFVVACVLLTLATMPIGFMTVYAINTFAAGEALVGQFTILMICGQIVGGVVNGFIADHQGNKLALLVASCSLLAASVSAFLAPALGWFYLVFFLLGANLGSELMTRYNLAIEFGPVEQRSTYIGLMNTVMAPFYLVALAGGWIADSFGYSAVFVTGILFSCIGITYLVTRVREPRQANPAL